jgi:hypothetical protein
MDLSMSLHKQAEKTSEMLSQFLSLQSQINTSFQQMFRRVEELEKMVSAPLKFGTDLRQDFRGPATCNGGAQATEARQPARVHTFPTPVHAAPAVEAPIANVTVTEPFAPQATTATPTPATPAPQTTSGLAVATEQPAAVSSGLASDDMGLL